MAKKDNDTTQAKERFCSILRDTARENIGYVIEDLEAWGFFDAPASSQGHGAYPGGLLEHSLNVYDAAMATRQSLVAARPDLENQLPADSVAIAALLHDVCKANFYQLTRRKKRNEIGIFEEVEQYEIHDENFPVGHGEKSVILLLQSGLDLTDARFMPSAGIWARGISHAMTSVSIVRPAVSQHFSRSSMPPTP